MKVSIRSVGTVELLYLHTPSPVNDPLRHVILVDLGQDAYDRYVVWSAWDNNEDDADFLCLNGDYCSTLDRAAEFYVERSGLAAAL